MVFLTLFQLHHDKDNLHSLRTFKELLCKQLIVMNISTCNCYLYICIYVHISLYTGMLITSRKLYAIYVSQSLLHPCEEEKS